MSQEQKLIEAEEAAKKQEELWQEQERKSKEAEIQRRSIARMAREEYRRSIQVTDIQTTEIKLSDDLSYSNSTPLSSLDVSLSKPPNKEAVMKWYREEELGRNSGLNSDGTSADWFHGLLSRHEAEDRLLHEKNGTFLVRLSEKIWGYAISYKALDRCKHYLVDSTNGKYRFLGANQISHESLGNLVKYHCNVPITESGQEFLTHSCKTSSDFISGLFQN